MGRRFHISVICLAGFAAGAFFGVIGLQAGSYHTSASGLVCSDCHSMHFSEDLGVPSSAIGQALVLGGGPWKKLLKYETVNGLCLSCHDGGGGGAGAAPDVLGPESFGYVRAAGQFCNVLDSNGNGHDLGIGGLLAIGGSWTTPAPAGMTCIECHDPHGTVNYRNLKLRPGGVAIDFYTTSVDEVANDPTSTQYAASNIRYLSSRGGVGRWCRSCHTNFHCNDNTGGATCDVYSNTVQGGSAAGDTTAGSADQWVRHPSRDVTLAEGCTNLSVDSADNLCNDATKGRWFNTAVVLSWLPVVSAGCGVGCTPGAGQAIPGLEATSDNEPFCGTCHKAHGAVNNPGCTVDNSGLIYDTPTTAAIQDDPGTCTRLTCLCQNCHYK